MRYLILLFILAGCGDDIRMVEKKCYDLQGNQIQCQN